MKLTSKTSYRLFLCLNFTLCAILSFLLILGGTPSTFAEEDAITSVGPFFVTLHDGPSALTIKTDAATVGEVISRTNLQLSEHDTTDPALDAEVNADNFHINIYRARPVIVKDGLTSKYIMSASLDPATIAADAGLTLYDGDEISLVPNQNFLEAGATTTFAITRGAGETITIESPIPYTEEKVKDDTLPAGQSKLEQVGEDGLKVSKYRINTKDGQEVSRELISEQITREPVKRIVREGTKTAAYSAPASGNYSTRPSEDECMAWARTAGVSEADIHIAIWLIYHESGCRWNAENQYSGAYGIPQALPGSKMASAGADWQTNPITQIRWMISYVHGRYGGWAGAKAWWDSHGWY